MISFMPTPSKKKKKKVNKEKSVVSGLWIKHFNDIGIKAPGFPLYLK